MASSHNLVSCSPTRSGACGRRACLRMPFRPKSRRPAGCSRGHLTCGSFKVRTLRVTRPKLKVKGPAGRVTSLTPCIGACVKVLPSLCNRLASNSKQKKVGRSGWEVRVAHAQGACAWWQRRDGQSGRHLSHASEGSLRARLASWSTNSF